MRRVEVVVPSYPDIVRIVAQLLEDASLRESLIGRCIETRHGIIERVDERGIASRWRVADLTGELSQISVEYTATVEGRNYIRLSHFEKSDEWLAIWRFLAHVFGMTERASVILTYSRPSDADMWRTYFGSSGKGACVETSLTKAYRLFDFLILAHQTLEKKRMELAQEGVKLASAHFSGGLVNQIAVALCDPTDLIYEGKFTESEP